MHFEQKLQHIAILLLWSLQKSLSPSFPFFTMSDNASDEEFEDEEDDDLIDSFNDSDSNSDMTVDLSSNEVENSQDSLVESEESDDHDDDQMDHENSDEIEAIPNPPILNDQRAVINNPSQPNQAAENIFAPLASSTPITNRELKASTSNPDESAQISASQMDSENTCIICTEMWTTSDDHHLVALKCGHLFGKSCIENWLMPSRNYNRCPQCNKPAKRRDIHKIYSRCVKPLDTWERDEALAKVKVLETKANSLEVELKKSEAKCKLLELEKDKLNLTIMSLRQMKSSISATSIDANIKNYISNRTSMFKVNSFKEFTISEGTCRRLCYSSLTESLAISTQSAKHDNPSFPKYGIKKIPLNASAKSVMINIHTQPIRDMVINKYDSTIASVSPDKTVKVTSFMGSNGAHLSATLDVAPWSLHFYETRPNYLYIGLNNGTVSVYDKRKFNESVLLLAAPTSKPVYSLSTIEYREKSGKKTALMSVQLDTCTLYKFSNESDPEQSNYQVIKLPVEGRFSSTYFDSKSGYSLLSCRPSQKHDKMTHLVC